MAELSLKDWPVSWEITAFWYILVSSYGHSLTHTVSKHSLNADSMPGIELSARVGN